MVAGARYRNDSLLVGRDRELALLRAAVAEPLSSEFSTVIVEGEPGVGKSALVAASVDGLHDGSKPALLLGGVCLPLASITVPFIGIRSAIRGLERTSAGDQPVAVPPDLDAAPARVPVLLDQWLDRLTAGYRVVITIDDLQWADEGTLDALMYVTAGPRTRPLAIVGTVRSPDGAHERPVDRWLGALHRLAGVEVIRLGYLTREDTAEQISSLLDRPADHALVEDVYLRTRGHPYLTELTVTALAPDASRLPPDLPADLTSAVLGAVRRLSPAGQDALLLLAIAGRPLAFGDLARLLAQSTNEASEDRASLGPLIDESLRAGVLVSRVNGLWFRHPLTAELLADGIPVEERRRLHTTILRFEEASAPRSGAELDHALRIVEHHFHSGDAEKAFASADETAVSARDAGAYPQELRLLLRAVELSTTIGLGEIRRRGLLERARRAAQDAGAFEDELEIMRHLLDFEDLATLERASLLMRQMMVSAITQLDMPSVEQCEAILRLTAGHPTSAQHARALSMWVEAKLEVAGISDVEGLAEASRMALDRAHEAGDASTLARALVAEGRVRRAVGDDAGAYEAYSTARPVALASREWVEFNTATGGLAELNGVWWSAQSARALRDGRLQLISAGAPHGYVAWLAASECVGWLFAGDWEECVGVLRFVAGRDPGPYSDAAARLVAARLAVLQGDPATASAHIDCIEALAQTHPRLALLGLDFIRAEVCLAKRDPLAALNAAFDGLERPEEPDFTEWLPIVAARALADLVDVEAETGECGRASEQLTRLLHAHPHIELLASGTPYSAAARKMLAALEALYVSEVARARRAVDQTQAWSVAIDALADAELPWEEAYACQRLAESLLRGAGAARRFTSARAAIARGLALADRLHATSVGTALRRLAALTRFDVDHAGSVALEPPHREHPMHPRLKTLSQREREVLSRIVAGDTYAQIATALYISEKTVSAHVSHILAKTGVSNRVELALLAASPRGVASDTAIGERPAPSAS